MWKKSNPETRINRGKYSPRGYKYKQPTSHKPALNTYKVFATVEYMKEYKVCAATPEEASVILEKRITRNNKTRESQGFSLGDIYIHEVKDVRK